MLSTQLSATTDIFGIPHRNISSLQVDGRSFAVIAQDAFFWEYESFY